MYVEILLYNILSSQYVIASFPKSSPTQIIITQNGIPARLSSTHDTPGLVLYAFTIRTNDDGHKVVHPLGTALHTTSIQQKSIQFKDYTCTPPQPTINIKATVQFSKTPKLFIWPHNLYAERNLEHIRPFGEQGLYPIDSGLDRIHSPFFDTLLGYRLPSGAFTLIPTEWTSNTTHRAHQVFEKRFQLACTRHGMTPRQFMSHPEWSVVADVITSHARERIAYTPDVQLYPSMHGTERWEVPREPLPDGMLNFAGDCEDFAREIVQTYKDFMTVVHDGPETPLGYLKTILGHYAPAMVQGAVGSEYHSIYVTEKSKFRNHIWGALIPKYIFMDHHESDKTYPILLCDATGYEVPTHTRGSTYACHGDQQTPEIPQNFYKYAIAAMTYSFQDQGIMDFIFKRSKEDKHYGCPFDDWWAGNVVAIPAAQYSFSEMSRIRHMLSFLRPVWPVLDLPEVSDNFEVHNGTVVRQTVRPGDKEQPPTTFQSMRRIYFRKINNTLAEDYSVEWFV